MATRFESMRVALGALEKRPLVITDEVCNLSRLHGDPARESQYKECLERQDGDARLGCRSGYLSFASELEGNMLKRCWLVQVEHNVPGQESRIDILTRALEVKDIGVDENLQGRLVLVLDGHVVVVRVGERLVVKMGWRGASTGEVKGGELSGGGDIFIFRLT